MASKNKYEWTNAKAIFEIESPKNPLAIIFITFYQINLFDN